MKGPLRIFENDSDGELELRTAIDVLVEVAFVPRRKVLLAFGPSIAFINVDLMTKFGCITHGHVVVVYGP